MLLPWSLQPFYGRIKLIFFYKRYSSNRAYKPNLKTKTRFFYIQQKKLYTPYGVYNLSKKIKR